jgi:hypothetical protein
MQQALGSDFQFLENALTPQCFPSLTGLSSDPRHLSALSSSAERGDPENAIYERGSELVYPPGQDAVPPTAPPEITRLSSAWDLIGNVLLI